MIRIPHIASLLLITLVSFSAHANVVVKKAAPVLQYKTFNPANPPPEMPPLRPGEIAGMQSEFGIQAQGDYEPLSRKRGEDGNWTTVVAVHHVTIALRLTMTIWVPPDVTEKIKKHEEGHRKISEMIYQKRADAAARAAGALMDGKRFTGEGPNWIKAASNAVDPVQQELGRAYLEATYGVSSEVNNIYDEITAHGTNAVLEEDAIRQAFERYEKEHPATRPAGKR